MKFFLAFLFLFLITFLSGCQTIDMKTQKAIEKENEELSKFLQQPETELKIEMGQPAKIVFDEKGSKFLIYINKKYGITCERSFEVNKKEIIVGFSSTGCF